MKAWRPLLLVGVLLLSPTKQFSQVSSRPPGSAPLVVTVTPWGPDQNAIDAARAMVIAHPSVRRYLDGTRNRLLSFELLESGAPGVPPSAFRVTFYDYTNNRAVIAVGRFNVPESLSVTLWQGQPQPSGEEFDAAVGILKLDPFFAPLLNSKMVIPYRPMPPVIETSADFHNDRIVTVGLLSRTATFANEIVGVNMNHETVVRFANGAPPRAIANSTLCGVTPCTSPTGGCPPGYSCSGPARGTAGQYLLTVTQDSTLIWRMLITRPSASSGTRGSAIDLENIDYLGKRVLKHAHVPMLNVQYSRDLCGPYRDWQYQEVTFIACGTDVAPGIRACDSPPQTIMESGTDNGNFTGVAYYVTSTEVVLMTEMSAGWYRYVNEWRFDINGTIRPRFLFGATSNSCVCYTHTHHAYFRFDFDIGGPDKNVVYEVNGTWFPIRRTTELMSLRSPTWNRRWLIENAGTGDKYMVIPRQVDGLTDVYGRGDVWFLRYHSGAEIDDGHNNTGPPGTEVDLAQFLNGESIDKQDIVMWYAGHSVHVAGTEDTDSVGPDIVPVSW